MLLCVSVVPSCGAVVVVLCCRVVWCCCIVSCCHVVLCCCVMLCCAVVIPASTAPAAASRVLLLGYVRLSETAVLVAIPFEEFYQATHLCFPLLMKAKLTKFGSLLLPCNPNFGIPSYNLGLFLCPQRHLLLEWGSGPCNPGIMSPHL